MIDLEAIKARLDAVTSGDWNLDSIGDVYDIYGVLIAEVHVDAYGPLIAHAPADIAALLAHVATLAHTATVQAQRAEQAEAALKGLRKAARTSVFHAIQIIASSCPATDAQAVQAYEELRELDEMLYQRTEQAAQGAHAATAQAQRAEAADDTEQALRRDKFALGEERRAEWIRAERAEAEVARLREWLRGALTLSDADIDEELKRQ